MSFKAENGVLITDAMFDEVANAYESGIWPTRKEHETVMGRPRISNEELVTITFRVPKSRVDAIEGLARKLGETRSEFLRDAIDKAIAASV
jgi:hypothetical protein